MRAINHALTGSLIGLLVSEPVVAVPAALASHFVCDAIPHHGPGNKRASDRWMVSKVFKASLYLDALLCLVLVVMLVWAQPAHWQLAVVCAFVAASPDFLLINRFLKALKGQSWKPGVYSKFASRIQWFEKPIGSMVEVAWLLAGVILLLPFIR